MQKVSKIHNFFDGNNFKKKIPARAKIKHEPLKITTMDTIVHGDKTKYTWYTTVVPATAGQRSFRGKMALRGRWPLVTGNGHMRHYVKSNTHIYFIANAQHFKAQRSITVLYTVRDETNNAENV